MTKKKEVEEVVETPVVEKEFDGVFYFTNATDEDFKVLWNNVEYIYLAKTSSPMIIANETLENIQEIRKKFAYKLAVREYHKSKGFKDLDKQGGLHPATYAESVLEPWVAQCLNPLPISKATVKTVPVKKMNLKGSKAVTSNDSLNEAFKDTDVPTLGKMSE